MFNLFMFGLSSADFVTFVATLRPSIQKWVVRAYCFGCALCVLGGLI